MDRGVRMLDTYASWGYNYFWKTEEMEINDIYLIVCNKGYMYICDTVVLTELAVFNTDQVNTLYNVSNKGFGVSNELAIFTAEHKVLSVYSPYNVSNKGFGVSTELAVFNTEDRRQGVKCLLTIQCI